MSASETKSELLAHLEKVTREEGVDMAAALTTVQIAADVNISRTLASQYLNDFVREGAVVKVNARPVIYLHRIALERSLQVHLDKSEYPSLAALLHEAGLDARRDFSRAIGHDLTLSPYIEQLKAAVSYPPHGLPVLLLGEPGCGKALLSRLALEYGKNVGALSAHARYARVNCALYAGMGTEFQRQVFGDSRSAGVADSVAGGVVFFENVDALDTFQREFLLGLLDEHGTGHGRPRASARTSARAQGPMPPAPPARLVLAASRTLDDAEMAPFVRAVPVVMTIPPLRDRTLEERTDFIKHFLRAEGRRVSADVSISRGALRTLAAATFDDNVDGLRSCVITCCSDAYASSGAGELVIRSYNLPAAVLGARSVQDDDDVLVGCEKDADPEDGDERQGFLEALLSAYEAFCEGRLSFGELLSVSTTKVREYQDYLNFERPVQNPRVLAYEQVLGPVFESVGAAHDVELTRKSARLLAQCLGTQLWCDDVLARWRQERAARIGEFAHLLGRHLRSTAVIAEQVAAEAKQALGLELDALSRLMLILDLNSSVSDARGKEAMGIICCHGYATATSMADAANRILKAHVFEAIDMTYDQQVTDLARPLRRIVERYAYCRTLVLLVDMGSLTELVSAVSEITDMDVVTVNNVSTALALEIGSALRAGEDVEAGLDQVLLAAAPTYSVSRRTHEAGTVVFCSESGTEAADKIRRLFAESLPVDVGLELVSVDWRTLAARGLAAPVFSRSHVVAIVGTMDPGVEGVPFLALENILYEGPNKSLDQVFSRSLDEAGLVSFHASLLKRLTLENVIESLTILNPEKLYAEVSSAVSRLAEKTAEKIAPAATLGLYVHLCCLVERIVTKTPIEAHVNEAEFRRDHADFIAAFRESFQDISDHYRVEVPVAEIAYVFDYIRSKSATRERAWGDVGESEQADE